MLCLSSLTILLQCYLYASSVHHLGRNEMKNISSVLSVIQSHQEEILIYFPSHFIIYVMFYLMFAFLLFPDS